MPVASPSAVSSLHVRRKRYGTLAAKIATSHFHKLGVSTHFARQGSKAYLIVQDVTRHPEEARQAKWTCRHPECAATRWDSKEELLAAHDDNRLLNQREETHLYYAVYECPAQPAVQEKKDEKGRVIQEAREAKPAIVMLLSDEE